MARAEAGNVCDSRAMPRRPGERPVAKSPAPSMPHPANQSGTASMPPAFPALALGASRREAASPDREEPGVARAEAGNVCDSRAMPRRPGERPVAKSPAPSMPHPANQSGTASMPPAFPALALGASRREAASPDREEPGVARAEAGNVCDSRAMPRRPGERPVAKSPAPSMPHPANQSGTASMPPASALGRIHPECATGSGKRSWIACTERGSVRMPSIARTQASAAGSVVMQGTP